MTVAARLASFVVAYLAFDDSHFAPGETCHPSVNTRRLTTLLGRAGVPETTKGAAR